MTFTQLTISAPDTPSPHDLVRRADLAAEYADLEQELGHQFRADMSMADIIAAAQAPEDRR